MKGLLDSAGCICGSVLNVGRPSLDFYQFIGGILVNDTDYMKLHGPSALHENQQMTAFINVTQDGKMKR